MCLLPGHVNLLVAFRLLGTQYPPQNIYAELIPAKKKVAA